MEVFKTHVRVFVLYTLFYMAHSRSAGPTTAFQYNVFCASPFHVLQTQERWLWKQKYKNLLKHLSIIYFNIAG